MHVSTLRRGGRRRHAAFTLIAVVVALFVATASGCGSGASSPGGSRHMTVFAAASLTGAFDELSNRFTAAHPGVKVTFSFAGSSDLVMQVQQGGPADVLATADTANMDKVGDMTGTPQVFASNKLMIAVAPGNPKHVVSLSDLAREDLKVVLAAPEVPAGKYAQQAFAKAGVTVQPVSLEESVKGVVAKISLGEADAGVVYVTDVSAAHGSIAGVAIPDEDNVLAIYPIATLKDSNSPEDARAFVDLVLSAKGRAVLDKYGFLPPP